MGLKVAVANGNWSNPATWFGGILPKQGDLVASNTYTITIDQDINVGGLTNTLQNYSSETVAMTSFTTPAGYVVESNSIGYGGSLNAFVVFDSPVPANGVAGTHTSWYGAPWWFSYEFPISKLITVYTVSVTGNSSLNPRDWTFEAWDGSSWVVLHTVTGASFASSTTLTYTFSNTTEYFKFRIYITNNRDNTGGNFTISEVRMFVDAGYMQNSFAGGGFILNGTYTITATGQGLVTGATRLLTYTGSNSVINGNIIGSTTTNVQTVYHDSTGALTINGNVINTANPTVDVIVTNSTGTLNINGNIQGDGRGINVYVLSVCTVNIIGNVTRGSNFSGGAALQINAGATVNVTGTLSNNAGGTGSPTIVVNSSSSILNVTGDVIFNGTQSSCHTITISQPGRVTVVGNVYNTGTGSYAIISQTNGYLSIIGSIYTTSVVGAVLSNNAGAVNLFSGPFICSSYGFFPYLVTRMHLIPSASSYIEFRDETTGGASAPIPPAPATQLISPSTLVSNLAITDVRFGTVYAMGTLTGTLRMPSANQVTFGVAVDDTFGNSVLTAASVWDYLVSNITTADSIGMRLKNVATPQTTGEQLEAFLRLD